MIAAALLAALLRLGELPRITESVTVGASGPGRVAAHASATVLPRDVLDTSPSLTLDQKLGATPGFSLFRRTSSRTANPTTQGLTLRGLSASGASRTLVTADGAALNDPFGGWVYWNRIPAAAIDHVQVTRGGSSNIDGSDALAGAVRIISRHDSGAELRVEGGSHETGRASLYGGFDRWAGVSGGIERASTEGYIPVEPAARGPVDTPASWRYTSAVGSAELNTTPLLIHGGGSFLSERRNNGTRLQTNGTRIGAGYLSLSGDVAAGVWNVRADLSDQDYDQTFTAVAGGRATERLTNVQHVDSRARKVSASWARSSRAASWLIDAALRRVDADLIENASLTASQQTAGLGANVEWRAWPRVTISAGARGEVWQSSSNQEPPGSETTIGLVATRLNASAWVGNAATLRVSLFNAYRAPTINELYRSFRVGDVTTLPNAQLDPEDAWGGEAALTMMGPRVTVRGVLFSTWQKGAIYSRTLPTIGPGTLRMRDNGDARATGLEIEAETHLRPWLHGWLSFTAGNSEFTSGELEGNRLPQVPVAQAAAGLRLTHGRWLASLDTRYAGQQFDDDRNTFELKAGAFANALGSVRFRRAHVFASVENIFDAEIDAGRTPLRTLAQPRMWQLGVRMFTR